MAASSSAEEIRNHNKRLAATLLPIAHIKAGEPLTPDDATCCVCHTHANVSLKIMECIGSRRLSKLADISVQEEPRRSSSSVNGFHLCTNRQCHSMALAASDVLYFSKDDGLDMLRRRLEKEFVLTGDIVYHKHTRTSVWEAVRVVPKPYTLRRQPRVWLQPMSADVHEEDPRCCDLSVVDVMWQMRAFHREGFRNHPGKPPSIAAPYLALPPLKLSARSAEDMKRLVANRCVFCSGDATEKRVDSKRLMLKSYKLHVGWQCCKAEGCKARVRASITEHTFHPKQVRERIHFLRTYFDRVQHVEQCAEYRGSLEIGHLGPALPQPVILFSDDPKKTGTLTYDVAYKEALWFRPSADLPPLLPLVPRLRRGADGPEDVSHMDDIVLMTKEEFHGDWSTEAKDRLDHRLLAARPSYLKPRPLADVYQEMHGKTSLWERIVTLPGAQAIQLEDPVGTHENIGFWQMPPDQEEKKAEARQSAPKAVRVSGTWGWRGGVNASTGPGARRGAVTDENDGQRKAPSRRVRARPSGAYRRLTLPQDSSAAAASAAAAEADDEDEDEEEDVADSSKTPRRRARKSRRVGESKGMQDVGLALQRDLGKLAHRVTRTIKHAQQLQRQHDALMPSSASGAGAGGGELMVSQDTRDWMIDNEENILGEEEQEAEEEVAAGEEFDHLIDDDILLT